jgi:hypothetical protein
MRFGKVVIFGSLFVTSKPHTLRNASAMRIACRVSLMRITVMTGLITRHHARFQVRQEF